MNKTLVLILLIVGLVIAPFFIDHGGEFGGADGQAEDQIMLIAPDYEPWFESLYQPASGEILGSSLRVPGTCHCLQWHLEFS